jgi:hypothetical protein
MHVLRQPEALGQSLQDERQRPGLTRRLEDLVHQVEVGVGALAAQLLEPGRARKEHVGELSRRIVHEEIV